MALRDEIEAHTNAANTSTVWKYWKLSERETQKSLQEPNTDSERLQRCFSCLRWEEEAVVVAGYCDDWNSEMASND